MDIARSVRRISILRIPGYSGEIGGGILDLCKFSHLDWTSALLTNIVRWVYIIATVAITVSLYYTFRVLPIQRKRKTKNVAKVETKKT